MPDKHQQAEEMRDDVPSTIARSDDKAVRTYKKTLESAEDTIGDPQNMNKDELVQAIEKANAPATARARRK
ncbi:hypothetical protein B0E53_01426 [Micromonospora sp. MH33]|uniref:hypothetical protein n=1 Tax=Micromonospora sp. MH33 TaxID=1945509 RepID=UPI000D148824|nr:hypothetical protein [Micromonospora sp. MH33]PSK66626.1 hypothetical protein B0E53_01426 [Micromonospora sp. MH33]